MKLTPVANFIKTFGTIHATYY
jgi:hypothetical protein